MVSFSRYFPVCITYQPLFVCHAEYQLCFVRVNCTAQNISRVPAHAPLFKKFFSSFVIQIFITVFTIRLLNSMLNHLIPVHNLISYYFKNHSSIPKFSKCYFPFRFQIKFLYTFLMTAFNTKRLINVAATYDR